MNNENINTEKEEITLNEKNENNTLEEFNKEIDKLESEKEYYKSEIYKDSSLIHKLENKKELEKFAREQYNMKKENEDIYIIARDTLKQSE